MDLFFIAIFVIFFVIPVIKRANNKKAARKFKRAQKTRANTWGKTHDQIAKTGTDQHGHSDAKARLRQRLRQQSGSGAFPKDHKIREQRRTMSDRLKNQKMEAAMHGKKNRAITKAGNKGRDDWGVRGEDMSATGLVIVVVLGAIAYFVFSFMSGA